jgi:predicted dehydrogenase
MNTVGLIGCGSIASSQYAPIIQNYFHDHRRLFYDINENAAAHLAGKLKGEPSTLEQLIDQSDFIIITSPPDTHYELLKSSIRSGKTIVCEKPFLLDINHAMEIIESANNVGANVFAAHLRRFFPAIIAAKKFIETNLMGKLKKVEIYEGGRFNWESLSGYHYKSPLGGVVPDTGSHAIDSMLYVLGMDIRDADFRLVDRSRIPEKEPSHVFKASFRIESGEINVEGNIYLSRRTALANKLNIYFEKGLIEVPLDLKNAVKISTHDGKTILDEKYPVKTFEQAFQEQFRHILEDKGNLLSAQRFINTTKLLQTLITG